MLQNLFCFRRLPVLTLWFFIIKALLDGFVISYAILFPVNFLHCSFFWESILIYFFIFSFSLIIFNIKFIPVFIVPFSLGLLCYLSMYSKTLCLEFANLYSSSAWEQLTKLSEVEAINITGKSSLSIFLKSYNFFMSKWCSFIILFRMYSIKC